MRTFASRPLCCVCIFQRNSKPISKINTRSKVILCRGSENHGCSNEIKTWVLLLKKAKPIMLWKCVDTATLGKGSLPPRPRCPSVTFCAGCSPAKGMMNGLTLPRLEGATAGGSYGKYFSSPPREHVVWRKPSKAQLQSRSPAACQLPLLASQAERPWRVPGSRLPEEVGRRGECFFEGGIIRLSQAVRLSFSARSAH